MRVVWNIDERERVSIEGRSVNERQRALILGEGKKMVDGFAFCDWSWSSLLGEDGRFMNLLLGEDDQSWKIRSSTSSRLDGECCRG